MHNAQLCIVWLIWKVSDGACGTEPVKLLPAVLASHRSLGSRPTVSVPICLSGKKWKGVHLDGPLPPTQGPKRSFRLLASSWPSPDCCSSLDSQPADTRFLPLCSVLFFLSFSVSLCLILPSSCLLPKNHHNLQI